MMSGNVFKIYKRSCNLGTLGYMNHEESIIMCSNG